MNLIRIQSPPSAELPRHWTGPRTGFVETRGYILPLWYGPWTVAGISLAVLSSASHVEPSALRQPPVSQIMPGETWCKVFAKRSDMKSSASRLPGRSVTRSQEEIRLVWENLVLTNSSLLLLSRCLQKVCLRSHSGMKWGSRICLFLPILFLKISMTSPLSLYENIFSPCSSSPGQLCAIFKYPGSVPETQATWRYLLLLGTEQHVRRDQFCVMFWPFWFSPSMLNTRRLIFLKLT